MPDIHGVLHSAEIDVRIGHSKTLLLPSLPACQGQRITEDRLRLVRPSRLPDRQFSPAGAVNN
jgi:hypothetical protein